MYCFARICRVCLCKSDSDSVKLNSRDLDQIYVSEKLKFCIPEINNLSDDFPDQICQKCYKMLTQLYEFKTMLIKNTATLQSHVSKLANFSSPVKTNLIINLLQEEIATEQLQNTNLNVDVDLKQKETMTERSQTTNLNVDNDLKPKRTATEQPQNINLNVDVDLKQKGTEAEQPLKIEQIVDADWQQEEIEVEQQPTENSVVQKQMENEDYFNVHKSTMDEVSRFSISLNQWDLFETKFTCRCIKEFNSFTEETTHLCKNCEGELLGFRLSKIKMNFLDSRRKRRLDESNSNFDQSEYESNEASMDSVDCERGFNYSDILLCKVHVNGVKKQINYLENITYNVNLRNSLAIKTEDSSDEETGNKNVDTLVTEQGPDLTQLEVLESTAERTETPRDDPKRVFDRKFKCPLCEKAYTRLYRLKMHYATHPNAQFLFCGWCHKKFVHKAHLEEHQEKKHGVVKNKITPVSSTQNNTKDLVKSEPIHLDSISKTNREILKHQQLAVLKPEPAHLVYQRNKHKIVDSNSSERNSIPRNKNQRRYNRTKLIKTEPDSTTFDNSVKDSSPNNSFRKFDPDNSLRNSTLTSSFEGSVQSLLKKELNTSDESLTCATCDKTFPHRSSLAIHLMTHFGNKEYKCETCHKGFFRKENLDKHNLTHFSSKTYPCHKCQMVYQHASNLRRHLKRHADEKYICSICNKQFTRKDVLQAHIYKEHVKRGQKKKVELHQCQICHQTFADLNNLAMHIRTHSIRKQSLKNHPVNSSRTRSASHDSPVTTALKVLSKKDLKKSYCSICQKNYGTRSHLIVHFQRIHVKGKVHECINCKKQFNVKFDFRKHKIKCKPVCKYCGKKYKRSWSLQEHTKQKHST